MTGVPTHSHFRAGRARGISETVFAAANNGTKDEGGSGGRILLKAYLGGLKIAFLFKGRIRLSR